MTWIYPVEYHRQLFVIRNNIIVNSRTSEIGLFETFFYRDAVSHGRQSAPYSALAYRDEHLAVLAEIDQVLDILTVAAAAFNDADIALLCELLYIIYRRLMKLDHLYQL